MDPIKIKAYGLINFTKKQYTITQTIIFTVFVLLFILSFFYNLDDLLFGNAKILILIVLVWEGFETFFMFKKFKEKEQKNNNL